MLMFSHFNLAFEPTPDLNTPSQLTSNHSNIWNVKCKTNPNFTTTLPVLKLGTDDPEDKQ